MTIISNAFHCVAFPGFTFFPCEPEVGIVEPVSEEALAGLLRNKQALVVGGTSGIGRGIAEALARCGASVVVVGSSSARGQAAVTAMSAVAKFPSEQKFRAITADLLTVKGCVALTKQINESLDFVVFTVGIWPDKESPRTTDGVDKVLALDVLARFVVTEKLAHLLNAEARVMSVLGSTVRAPPAPSIETMKQLMTGVKSSYSTPQMLGAAGSLMDTWLQSAPKYHPGVTFIGTFPGIVGTGLITTSKTIPSCFRCIAGKVQKVFAMTPTECGMNHLQVLVSPNANKYPTTYFNTIRLEGRRTNPVAYDSEFGEWVWSFLEDRLAKLR